MGFVDIFGLTFVMVFGMTTVFAGPTGGRTDDSAEFDARTSLPSNTTNTPFSAAIVDNLRTWRPESNLNAGDTTPVGSSVEIIPPQVSPGYKNNKQVRPDNESNPKESDTTAAFTTVEPMPPVGLSRGKHDGTAATTTEQPESTTFYKSLPLADNVTTNIKIGNSTYNNAEDVTDDVSTQDPTSYKEGFDHKVESHDGNSAHQNTYDKTTTADDKEESTTYGQLITSKSEEVKDLITENTPKKIKTPGEQLINANISVGGSTDTVASYEEGTGAKYSENKNGDLWKAAATKVVPDGYVESEIGVSAAGGTAEGTYEDNKIHTHTTVKKDNHPHGVTQLRQEDDDILSAEQLLGNSVSSEDDSKIDYEYTTTAETELVKKTESEPVKKTESEPVKRTESEPELPKSEIRIKSWFADSKNQLEIDSIRSTPEGNETANNVRISGDNWTVKIVDSEPKKQYASTEITPDNDIRLNRGPDEENEDDDDSDDGEDFFEEYNSTIKDPDLAECVGKVVYYLLTPHCNHTTEEGEVELIDFNCLPADDAGIIRVALENQKNLTARHIFYRDLKKCFQMSRKPNMQLPTAVSEKSDSTLPGQTSSPADESDEATTPIVNSSSRTDGVMKLEPIVPSTANDVANSSLEIQVTTASAKMESSANSLEHAGNQLNEAGSDSKIESTTTENGQDGIESENDLNSLAENELEDRPSSNLKTDSSYSSPGFLSETVASDTTANSVSTDSDVSGENSESKFEESNEFFIATPSGYRVNQAFANPQTDTTRESTDDTESQKTSITSVYKKADATTSSGNEPAELIKVTGLLAINGSTIPQETTEIFQSTARQFNPSEPDSSTYNFGSDLKITESSTDGKPTTNAESTVEVDRFGSPYLTYNKIRPPFGFNPKPAKSTTDTTQRVPKKEPTSEIFEPTPSGYRLNSDYDKTQEPSTTDDVTFETAHPIISDPPDKVVKHSVEVDLKSTTLTSSYVAGTVSPTTDQSIQLTTMEDTSSTGLQKGKYLLESLMEGRIKPVTPATNSTGIPITWLKNHKSNNTDSDVLNDGEDQKREMDPSTKVDNSADDKQTRVADQKEDAKENRKIENENWKSSKEKITKRVIDPLMPYPETYPEEYQTIQNGPAIIITKTTYTRIPDVTYTTVTMATLPTFEQMEKAEDGFTNSFLEGREVERKSEDGKFEVESGKEDTSTGPMSREISSQTPNSTSLSNGPSSGVRKERINTRQFDTGNSRDSDTVPSTESDDQDGEWSIKKGEASPPKDSTRSSSADDDLSKQQSSRKDQISDSKQTPPLDDKDATIVQNFFQQNFHLV